MRFAEKSLMIPKIRIFSNTMIQAYPNLFIFDFNPLRNRS